tara:strand:- start:641 stop:823 length:183 start_codon:yes stop_codon:yes gene_type:complete
MKYAVMFEPFNTLEYVCESSENNSWVTGSNPKYFKTKEEAETEAKKWNTGVVVEIKEKNE